MWVMGMGSLIFTWRAVWLQCRLGQEVWSCHVNLWEILLSISLLSPVSPRINKLLWYLITPKHVAVDGHWTCESYYSSVDCHYRSHNSVFFKFSVFWGFLFIFSLVWASLISKSLTILSGDVNCKYGEVLNTYEGIIWMNFLLFTTVARQ